MKKAKTRAQRRRVAMLRKVLLTLTLVMVVAMVTVGGTIAWLADKTDDIVNTFTVGDIEITLEEDEGEVDEDGNHVFHIVPGVDIPKDPTVTVTDESESCWLFVTVKEENWPTPTEVVNGETVKKVNYQIEAGWTELEGQNIPNTKVYYRTVASDAAVKTFSVLANDEVTVSENLSKSEAKEITVAPKLTFQAYAVQSAEITEPADAWSKAQDEANY